MIDRPLQSPDPNPWVNLELELENNLDRSTTRSKESLRLQLHESWENIRAEVLSKYPLKTFFQGGVLLELQHKVDKPNIQ